MFGLSLGELIVIGVVTLVAVGPQKLPGMLHTMGRWLKKLRQLTTEVRAQTGIDEILRAEGIHGGLTELRQLTRGGGSSPAPRYEDPYATLEIDATREYPPEGVDSYGSMPDDLLDEPAEPEAEPLVAEVKAS